MPKVLRLGGAHGRHERLGELQLGLGGGGEALEGGLDEPHAALLGGAGLVEHLRKAARLLRRARLVSSWLARACSVAANVADSDSRAARPLSAWSASSRWRESDHAWARAPKLVRSSGHGHLQTVPVTTIPGILGLNDQAEEGGAMSKLRSRNGSPRVVVVGGGFAGLSAVKTLAKVKPPVRVTLLEQHNYHLFQPLLYQLATGVVQPADIAHPVRGSCAATGAPRCGWPRCRGWTSTPRRS